MLMVSDDVSTNVLPDGAKHSFVACSIEILLYPGKSVSVRMIGRGLAAGPSGAGAAATGPPWSIATASA